MNRIDPDILRAILAATQQRIVGAATDAHLTEGRSMSTIGRPDAPVCALVISGPDAFEVCLQMRQLAFEIRGTPNNVTIEQQAPPPKEGPNPN